jgi:hypothetical protein
MWKAASEGNRHEFEEHAARLREAYVKKYD